MAPTTFLSLPRELRDDIYRYYIVGILSPLCGIGDKHRFFDCQKLHGPQILDTISPEYLGLFNQDELPKQIASEALEELSSYWTPYETLVSIRRFMRQPARFPRLLELRTYVTRITLGVHIKQAMAPERMQRDWANSKFYDGILSEQSDIFDDLTKCRFLRAFHIQIWDYDPQQHKSEQLLSRSVPRIERLCELLATRLGDGLVVKVLARRKKTVGGQHNQYEGLLERFTQRPSAYMIFSPLTIAYEYADISSLWKRPSTVLASDQGAERPIFEDLQLRVSKGLWIHSCQLGMLERYCDLLYFNRITSKYWRRHKVDRRVQNLYKSVTRRTKAQTNNSYSNRRPIIAILREACERSGMPMPDV